MDTTWVAIGAGVIAVLLLAWAFARPRERAPTPTPAPRDPSAPPDRSSTTSAASPEPVAQPAPSMAEPVPSIVPLVATPSTEPTATEPTPRDGDEREGTTVASVPPPAAVVPVHVTTAEGVDLAIEDADGAGLRASAMVLVTAHGRTDAGRHRKHNEDSYLLMADDALFVIADGMGGYAAGEVASQLALDVLKSAIESGTFAGTPVPGLPRRADELVRGIRMGNAAILAQARENEAQHRMGTTIVGCRFSPDRSRVYIAHVGDSRCYRLRAGAIEAMTTDHTLGAVGITGPSAVKLSRAVGVGDDVEIDLRVDSPRVGDRYLLCSDGLSRMVRDEVIRDLVVGASSLQAAVDALVAAAIEGGGRDNITVILVELRAPEPLRIAPATAAPPRTSERPRPRPASIPAGAIAPPRPPPKTPKN